MKIMLRLFTCIWIPDDIRKMIVEFQEKLKKVPIKAKFVEPENLHLTITFLGNVNETEVESLKNKLDDCVKDVKKFHVKLEGLKLIPGENYIRVIGLKIMDEGNVSRLIKRIGKSMDGKYHETSKLTLCRVKNVLDKKKLREFIEENRNVIVGSFHVKSVALVKSTLTKHGPVYETIHESMLRA